MLHFGLRHRAACDVGIPCLDNQRVANVFVNTVVAAGCNFNKPVLQRARRRTNFFRPAAGPLIKESIRLLLIVLGEKIMQRCQRADGMVTSLPYGQCGNNGLFDTLRIEFFPYAVSNSSMMTNVSTS